MPTVTQEISPSSSNASATVTMNYEKSKTINLDTSINRNTLEKTTTGNKPFIFSSKTDTNPVIFNTRTNTNPVVFYLRDALITFFNYSYIRRGREAAQSTIQFFTEWFLAKNITQSATEPAISNANATITIDKTGTDSNDNLSSEYTTVVA